MQNEFEEALQGVVDGLRPEQRTNELFKYGKSIIHALKKQIPKRIRKADIGGGIFINVCSDCEALVHEHMRFCCRCGQRIANEEAANDE